MRKSRLNPGKQTRLMEYLMADTVAQTVGAFVSVNKSIAAYSFLRLRMIITQALAEKMPLNRAIEGSG